MALPAVARSHPPIDLSTARPVTSEKGGRPETLEMYAFRRHGDGLSLHGTRKALERLGAALEGGQSMAFVLQPPPIKTALGEGVDEVVVRQRPSADDPVSLSIDRRGLVIEGGRTRAGLLGRELRNLAKAPVLVTDESVPTHLDIEHYETHSYLAPSEIWITAFVHDRLTGDDG